MKKILFVFLIYYGVYDSINGQKRISYKCDILESLLSIPDFQFYYSDSIKNKTLIIVDTSKYFLNCNLIVKDRKVVVINKWENWRPNLGNNFNYKYHLILNNIKKTKKYLNISIWEPYSNLTGKYRIDIKKNKIKIIERGAF